MTKAGTINTARTIALFNKKIFEYNDKGFAPFPNNEKNLSIEREKLMIILKKRFPEINIDDLLAEIGNKNVLKGSLDVNKIINVLERLK